LILAKYLKKKNNQKQNHHKTNRQEESPEKKQKKLHFPEFFSFLFCWRVVFFLFFIALFLFFP
jgi:quinol-cytochrome oxidoreductase complex cytochrome b subunit